MQVELNRQKSFFMGQSLWPHAVQGWLATPETLAKAGFYFTPIANEENSDCATCYLCQKTLDGWEPSDDAVVEHDKHSPQCALTLLRHPERIHDGSQLEQARLATFGTWWPHDGKRGFVAKSKEMAKSGFCFIPSDEPDSDMVQCLNCGLVLDGWEKTDVPMNEHARRSPDCVHIKAMQSAPAAKKRRTKKEISPYRASTASRESLASTASTVRASRRRQRRESMESVSTVMTEDTVVAEEPRRRGRKVKAVAAVEVPVDRPRRGRPPKEVQQQEVDAEMDKQQQEVEMLETEHQDAEMVKHDAELSEQPPKRRRGRPPKALVSDGTGASTSTDTSRGTRRGRMAKPQATVEVVEASTEVASQSMADLVTVKASDVLRMAKEASSSGSGGMESFGTPQELDDQELAVESELMLPVVEEKQEQDLVQQENVEAEQKPAEEEAQVEQQLPEANEPPSTALEEPLAAGTQEEEVAITDLEVNKENKPQSPVAEEKPDVSPDVIVDDQLPFPLSQSDLELTVEEILKKLHAAEIQRLVQTNEETLKEFLKHVNEKLAAFKQSVQNQESTLQ